MYSLTHLTLSLPKKSKWMVSPTILMCSFRRVMAPTVSASSGSFSSPTLMLGTKISHETVATFRLSTSLSSRFLRICASICLICLPKVSAFWNFSFSRFCFKKRGVAEPDVLDFACKFVFPLCHVHLVGFPNDAFPVPSGFEARLGGKLRIMSCSLGPSFHFPRCGWSPRPAKRHDGSDVQLAISSFCPSTSA